MSSTQSRLLAHGGGTMREQRLHTGRTYRLNMQEASLDSEAVAERAPPARLPLAGRIVAYLLLTLGLGAIIGAAYDMAFNDRISLDLASILFAVLGWQLLQGRKSAPGCAGMLIAFSLIGSLLGIAVVLAIPLLPQDSIRLNVNPPNSLLTIVFALIVWSVVMLWALRVLKRPDVKDYCNDVQRKRQRRQFRLEHLLVVTAIVAFAIGSITLRSQLEPSSPYSSSTVQFKSGVETMADQTKLHFLMTTTGPDTKPQTIVRLCQVFASTEHLANFSVRDEGGSQFMQVGIEEFRLSGTANLHEVRDGKLVEVECDLTEADYAAFLKTLNSRDPNERGVEALKRYVEERVSEPTSEYLP